jgi:hypothetical protein
MKTTLSAITLALVFSATGSVADDGLVLIQPPESKLIVTKVDLKKGLYAEFKGQMQVTGKLVAQWIVGDDDVTSTLNISLLPDEKSIKVLPHLGRYSVEYIALENGKEALRMSVGKKILTQLEQKQVNYLSANGSFLVERYVVGVECDQAWASAKVVQAHVLKPLNLAGIAKQNGC